MNITEIYNMKVNMGLLDLKKYNNLINEIENVPQKYIDVFDLKNIGNKLKEELKLNNINNNIRKKGRNQESSFS